ncbi:MAG: SH3 domain-containing protein, partial [Dorea sp.]|nr:SH3 domain-containing protein [Dorea sp.]
FVIVRVAYRQWGDGVLVTDPCAIAYLQGAKAAGLDVGAYIYSQAITEKEASAEANKASKVVVESGVELDLPLVLDYEYDPYLEGRLYKKNLNVTAATAVCKSFVTRAKELGYQPMVYANRSMFSDQMDALQLEKESQIWLAEWGTSTPKYKGAYDFWQYSENGLVAGINGYVDMDYQYIPRIERGTAPTTLPGLKPDNPEEPDTTPVLPENTDYVDGQYITYTPVKAETGQVVHAYVNVRKGPGTTFYWMGEVYKNQTFTVNGTCRDAAGVLWYRVEIELNGVNTTGYICSDYVCLKSEIPKAPTLKQTTQTMSSIKLTWTKVAGADKYKIYRYNYTTGKYVGIATVAGTVTTYTDKGLISYKKQKYVVKAIKYKFGNYVYSPSSNSRIGYTGGLKGYVNRAAGLAVHSGIGTKDNLCTLNNNERVNIIANSGNWYKVYYDHFTTTKVGYVNKKYIRL